MRVLLILPLFAGCGWSIPRCEPVADETVADDEETPVGSASDMLDALVGDVRLDGAWWDGRPASAQVTVTRGVGSARWVETDGRSHRQLGGTNSIFVQCHAFLEVPMHATVHSDDDKLFVDIEALHVWPYRGDEPYWLEHEAHFRGPYLGQRIPDGDEDPGRHTDLSTRISTEYLDGELVYGNVGWSGKLETDEYVRFGGPDVLVLGEKPALSEILED